MATFRQWQHWRWKGGGRTESSSEKAIKSVSAPSEKPKKDK